MTLSEGIGLIKQQHTRKQQGINFFLFGTTAITVCCQSVRVKVYLVYVSKRIRRFQNAALFSTNQSKQRSQNELNRLPEHSDCSLCIFNLVLTAKFQFLSYINQQSFFASNNIFLYSSNKMQYRI
jgi:hypothetical protein